MPATRAWLIWNPVAGRKPERRRKQINDLATELSRGGWQIELAETVPEGGAGPAAVAAVQSGCDFVIGCGGDGTLHEILNAMMTLPAPHPAIGVAPCGTANIVANAVGCAVSQPRVATCLLQARPAVRPLGVARAESGQRYFLAVASAGLDAQVVHTMTPGLKRRWGKLAYAGSALAQARHYFPAPIEFECNGKRSHADGIIVGLSRFYGGRLKLGRVEADRSIILALRGAPWRRGAQALALATVGLEHGPGVERLCGDSIRLLTQGRPLELDGEPAGQTPVELSVLAGGVRVLVR